MDRLPLAVLVFISLTPLFVLSCIDSAIDTESGPAVIQGRIDEINSGQNSRTVENAVLTAAWVSAAGDLETIGETEAQADANGVYTLNIEAEAWEEVATDSRIVLSAEKEEALAKTFITSEIISGIMVQAKPITVESTAEANVLQEVVANDDEGNIQNADIELAVTPAVTSALDSNPQNVPVMATTLSLQNEVKSVFYERQGIDPDYSEIYRMKNEAQVELENRLHDLGESPEDRQTAFDSFMRTMANIEMDVGIEPFQAAGASVLSSQVAWNESTELPMEARADLYRVYSYKAAVAVINSVENQLESGDFRSGTTAIAEEAGQTLQEDILDTTEATAEEIRALFDTYREQILTAIENSGIETSETLISINDLVRSENGAQITFGYALNNASEPEQYAEAYNQFSSEVRSEVNTGFNDLEGDTSEAYANLLILLNIAS